MVQVEAGPQVVDVSVSTVDVDEERILRPAVQTVPEAVDVLIGIDTADRTALGAALAVCPGRPLVKSVTGEETFLEAVLPSVKE